MNLTGELIAVLDVGKTNAKLALVEAGACEASRVWQRPSRSIETPLGPCLDVRGIEAWVISTLAQAGGREQIRALVPIAHGAAAVLVDSRGEIVTAPDYEARQFETVAEPYRAFRDDYATTCSPFLPLGLNLGRQFFFLKTRHPSAYGQAARVLLYPQFWAWRFSGVAGSEVTSLACHTDLWDVRHGHYSPAAERLGLDALLPPIRSAAEVLGPISVEFAQATGLRRDCRVLCGIHDSNASYLCHSSWRPPAEPMTVVSSGTWVVVMARGADLSRLRESEGMLANVDAHGTPVATARFMGGREYAAISGGGSRLLSPDLNALRSVVRRRVMAVPPNAESGNVDPSIDAASLDCDERHALASVYCALRVERLLELLDAAGDVVVDGPMAENASFCALLATLRPRSKVVASTSPIGPALAASILASPSTAQPPVYRGIDGLQVEGLADYRAAWRGRLVDRAQ